MATVLCDCIFSVLSYLVKVSPKNLLVNMSKNVVKLLPIQWFNYYNNNNKITCFRDNICKTRDQLYTNFLLKLMAFELKLRKLYIL